MELEQVLESYGWKRESSSSWGYRLVPGEYMQLMPNRQLLKVSVPKYIRFEPSQFEQRLLEIGQDISIVYFDSDQFEKVSIVTKEFGEKHKRAAACLHWLYRHRFSFKNDGGNNHQFYYNFQSDEIVIQQNLFGIARFKTVEFLRIINTISSLHDSSRSLEERFLKQYAKIDKMDNPFGGSTILFVGKYDVTTSYHFEIKKEGFAIVFFMHDLDKEICIRFDYGIPRTDDIHLLKKEIDKTKDILVVKSLF